MIHWDQDSNIKDDTPYGGDNRHLKIFDNTTRTDVITGYYEVPSKGPYYVEIIGLLCNDFSFDFDYNPICLEDPVHNHLTAPSSIIQVTHATNISNGRVGHWKWVDNTDPIPMYTRYQGQNCRKSNELRCTNSSSLERFRPYEFAWSDWADDINESFLQYPASADNVKICSGGYSHANYLRNGMQYWVNKFNITNVDVSGWIEMRYPKNMNDRNANITKDTMCNKTIIALVQWSAGRKMNTYAPGVLLPQYKKELRKSIETWKSLNMDFYFRKGHYSPIGDLIGACPPRDHRSPPVIDGYNEVIRNLAREYSVPFIDTSDIIDPIWDSSEDFCHLQGINLLTESLYILKQVLHDLKLGR